MEIDLSTVDRIIDNNGAAPSALISILQDVQDEYRYLPQEGMIHIAQRLSIPLSQVYNVATFYTAFSLEPRGKYLVSVCLGTACHVRGGVRIMESIERRFGIREGATSRDGNYTLERVNCLGCCAVGPIVVVNGKYYGGVNTTMIDRIFRPYDKKTKGKGKP